jgi:3-oxoacid CoA-transferase
VATVCVFDVDRKAGKLILTELQPGVTLEQVKEATGAKYDVSKDLKSTDV